MIARSRWGGLILLVASFFAPGPCSAGGDSSDLFWRVSPTPILAPGPSGTYYETAVKDPSIVYAEGAWRLFFTARGLGGYSVGYASSEHLSELGSSRPVWLEQLRGSSDPYAAAPQVFHFSRTGEWFLIFQTRDSNYQPYYSTTRTIGDPTSWSEPRPLISKDEESKWIDFWVIGDGESVYLFYTSDHREVRVRSTRLSEFPEGWGPAKTVFGPVHEAVHVYRVRGSDEYHLLYEERDSADVRRFGLARAKTLLGPWERISHSYAAGDRLQASKEFPLWTEELSHGEFVRSGSDERMEYDPDRPLLLFQGLLREDHHDDYPNLGWKIGAATGRSAHPPTGFERRTFRDDYGSLSCLQREGEGDPLVLIPGTFSDATQWLEVVRHLPPKLPLVLIDMRGHGESWPPKPVNSIEELAENTLWLLSQLGIDRAVFGGHSLGGMISKEIGRSAPERTIGVISVEGWTHHEAARLAFRSDMTATLIDAERKESDARRVRIEASWGRAAMLEFATAWRRWDGRPFMETTDLPILEVYGDRGRERADREALMVPDRQNIRLVWIADSAHDLPRQRPRETAEAIGGFLRGIP